MRRSSLNLYLIFIFSHSVAHSTAEHSLLLSEVESIAAQNSNYRGKGFLAESRKDEAFSKLMHWTPNLTAAASKSNWNPNSGGSSAESTGYSVSSAWNLFAGGKGYYQSKAAEATSLGAERVVVEAKRLAEIAAARLIFKKLYLAEQIKVYSGLAEIKRESLKVVQERFRRGQAPQQEVTKSQIDLSQAESRVRSAELEMLSNKVEMANYLDHEIRLQNWPLIAEDKWKSSLADAEKTPLAQSLNLELQAAEFSYKAANSIYSPSLDLTLSYMDGPDQNKINYGTTASITLTLPIWSQGETMSLVSTSFASMRSLEVETSYAKHDLVNQRKVADERMSLARQNLVEAEQNMKRVKSLYQGIQKAFQLGRISVNDLFLEQSRILDVELNDLTQQYNFHTSYVENCLLFNASLKECFLD